MEHELDPAQITQILQITPVGVLVLDADNRIIWANQTVEKFLHKTANDLVSCRLEDLSAEDLNPAPGQEDLWRIPERGDRRERWLKRFNETLASGASGGNKVQFFIDVTEYKYLRSERDRLAEQLREAAPIDAESGLLTKKAILQNLELLVSRSRRYNNPLSVVMMEIRDLTPQQGQLPELEQILVATGQLLKDQMRWADLISHTEKKQFLFVLPETSNDAALKLIDKIRSHLEGLTVPYVTGDIVHVSADFGVAEWKKGNDEALLLSRADDALETAKSQKTATVLSA
jgi:diguanylate cyclase (GGDEF)-like protein